MSPPAKALLTVAAGLSLISPAAADKPELLLKNVDNWWVVDEGKTLIVQAAGRIRRVDPGTRDAKGLKAVAGVVRYVHDIAKGVIAYERRGRDAVELVVLNTVTGKTASRSLQQGSFKVLRTGKGRRQLLVIAMQTGEEAQRHVHRVNLDPLKAEAVYGPVRDGSIFAATISPDGKQLIVWVDSGDATTLVRQTVDIATGKAETDRVARGQGLYPLPGGSGHVVRRKDKLYVVRGGKERELFEGKYRASARPDVPLSPRRLAVMRLTDTNKDGKVSKEDGDLPEIWVLDLATLKKKRIADAKQQNLMRGWSADGECLAFKRWEPPELDSRRLVSALVVYDATTGQAHYSFPAKGGLSVRFVAFLPGGWALTRDINLLSKTPSKELPFLFGFRHEDRRIAIPEPKKKVAVVGKWLVMSDHDKSGKPRDLFRWKLPEE